MSERLTRSDVEQLVDYLDAHWPSSNRTKWSNIATIYPTLAQYDFDLLMAAAKARVFAGDEYMPTPVKLLATCRQIIKDRAVDRRRQEGVSSDHPRGHVWGVLPDVLQSDETAFRVAQCAICGETTKAPTDRLLTVGEREIRQRREPVV